MAYTKGSGYSVCSLLVYYNPYSLESKLITGSVVFLVVMLAKKIMLEVDVSELENMRYRYKGA